MKAPEKIIIGKSNITSDGDVVFAWVTTESDCEAMQHNIEYIRTDVFLEKACKYLRRTYAFSDYNIEHLKNYMKDESEN